jgi:acyl-CoA synthetase (AMP-forming)/AMP-acid ligase II
MLSISEMLSRTARDHPDKEAIVDRGLRVSFSELALRSTRIARFLRSRGVEKGMRVGIYSSKCAAEADVIFALAKLGCVMVHINPSFRDAKLHHVIEETEPAAFFFHPGKSAAIERARQRGILPPLLICLGKTADRSAPPAVELEAVLEQGQGSAWADTAGSSAGEEPAAILYTSGTTASSKGIIVTHRILSESTLVSAHVLRNVAGDRLISVTPFSFDGALSQLFTATLVGATLVLQGSHFPKDVVTTMVSEKITGFHAVPSFWRMMLDQYPSFADCEFPHLRYLSLIGEVFPEDELRRLKQILGKTEFYMMYGTTEAFRSTCLAPADFARKPGSVGRPLPGVKIAIVDEEGHNCPTGRIGEIVHRGAFVSPGYWKRNGDATFRRDGVHTGDLGRLDEDGYLYFVGRKDTMIKRLGYQVYPEEIEACLETIDGVSMAAVVCAPDRGSGPRIHAFLVLTTSSDLSQDGVMRCCRASLPHYMIPDELAFRFALPRTATGKVDRSRLLAAGEVRP